MEQIKAGMRVQYTSPHGTIENGIVKSVNESGTAAFVVYNCGNDWDNYQNYTGQHTNINDLSIGWLFDRIPVDDETDANGRPYNGR